MHGGVVDRDAALGHYLLKRMQGAFFLDAWELKRALIAGRLDPVGAIRHGSSGSPYRIRAERASATASAPCSRIRTSLEARSTCSRR